MSESDGSDPPIIPPTYILNLPHFHYHDQDNLPDLIPIKMYDTVRLIQFAVRVKLLELALTTVKNFRLEKEQGCNYYFYQLPTHNDEVFHELISDILGCMNEGLIISPDDKTDHTKWTEITGAYTCGYLVDGFSKLTRTINYHQNWNSYATGAGIIICNLVLMLVNIGADNINSNF